MTGSIDCEGVQGPSRTALRAWLRETFSIERLTEAAPSREGGSNSSGYLLTLVDAEHAGRAYAAYGGVYIVASLAWLWIVEGARPDRWDVIGAIVCLGGAAIILFGPRAS